jgi:hypothetical protein
MTLCLTRRSDETARGFLTRWLPDVLAPIGPPTAGNPEVREGTTQAVLGLKSAPRRRVAEPRLDPAPRRQSSVQYLFGVELSTAPINPPL